MTAPPPRVWKQGEGCQLICPDGRAVEASVELACSNGYSLALSFEAIIGGWVGMMILLWNPAAARFESFGGEPFELKEPSHGNG